MEELNALLARAGADGIQFAEKRKLFRKEGFFRVEGDGDHFDFPVSLQPTMIEKLSELPRGAGNDAIWDVVVDVAMIILDQED